MLHAESVRHGLVSEHGDAVIQLVIRLSVV
jgi:hypothetical protein